MKKKLLLVFSLVLLVSALLPLCMAFAGETTTINGVTFTKNSDGSLTKDGRDFSYTNNQLTYSSADGNFPVSMYTAGGVTDMLYNDGGTTHLIDGEKDYTKATTGDTGGENTFFNTTDATDTLSISDPNLSTLISGLDNGTTNNNTDRTPTTTPATTTPASTTPADTTPADTTPANTTNASSKSSGGLVPCGHGNSKANACTLCDFIVGFQKLVEFAAKILITVAVVGIFISGVIYIISSGNEGLVTQAKNFLSASLVGFTIVLSAWLLVNVVMWALSYNTSVIGQTNWYTFDCTSTAK